jgi:hypothetical protein
MQALGVPDDLSWATSLNDDPIHVEATLDPRLVPRSRCLARVLHTTGAG